MTLDSSPFIFLPGSGGGTPDLSLLNGRFEVIPYPRWRRFVFDQLSADRLIQELTEEIATRVPNGPIKLVGLSIGGHFGYAAALRLRAMGRDIAGLCALDSFVVNTSEPTPGWQGRAAGEALQLLRGGRIGALMHFLRSRFWRAQLRLAGPRLPQILKYFPWLPSVDPLLEQELTMRLFVRETAPWLANLDLAPAKLDAPVVLLRTSAHADSDHAWRVRCLDLQIQEIQGEHYTLFEPENIGLLRDVFLATTQAWFQNVDALR